MRKTPIHQKNKNLQIVVRGSIAYTINKGKEKLEKMSRLPNLPNTQSYKTT